MILNNKQQVRIRTLDILIYNDFFCSFVVIQMFMDCRLSPFTGIIQDFAVTAAGCYMAAFPVPVHILAAAQRLLLFPLHLGSSLLHVGQPRQPIG